MTSSTSSQDKQDEFSVNKIVIPGAHLPYLDGLRGIAALYVVFYHTTLYYYLHPTSTTMQMSLSWLQRGNWAVDIFIVLSGYCLMLPCVRSRNLKAGFYGFLSRRAKRILPPYYAVLLITLFSYSMSFSDLHWVGSEFSLLNVVSHLLLVHDWFREFAMTINPVLWSIATEWQIYFIFCFILFPLWKKLV